MKVLVLQESTQQVKTDNHNSLRTKTALLPAAPETHTRNIGYHLQDCPWARKRGWGEVKLKCHKGLLPGFSLFFSWLSIHLVAVNLWPFSRVLIMLILTVFASFSVFQWRNGPWISLLHSFHWHHLFLKMPIRMCCIL